GPGLMARTRDALCSLSVTGAFQMCPRGEENPGSATRTDTSHLRPISAYHSDALMTSPSSTRWKLSAEALESLLARLGPDPESAGQEYEAVRGSLILFFDRRGMAHPDALADETLDRVARRLAEGEVVAHLHGYVFGVAQRVCSESQRSSGRERAAAVQAN